jgi:hypothetical protein
MLVISGCIYINVHLVEPIWLYIYIYLAGDIVVVQLSPIPHQQNSMLETVNTCMTSVYICVLPSIIYKFSSLNLFDAWLLDNVCVPPRCSWRVKKVHISIIARMRKKRRGTFVYLFSFCKWQHYRYILVLLLLLSILGCPVRIYASAISSSFNYKVNEILDDFSLQEK